MHVNQERAEIRRARAEVAGRRSAMNGVMDDWRALRYTMNVTSTVDLTQLSDVAARHGTRGAGNFSGTITGEGDQFTSSTGRCSQTRSRRTTSVCRD